MARRYKAVLINVDPKEWALFKTFIGEGKASKEVRLMVKTYNAKMKSARLPNAK